MSDEELRKLDAEIHAEVFGGWIDIPATRTSNAVRLGSPAPPYSSEIQWAWQVVEKLTGGMIQFRLEITESGRIYAKFVDCREPQTVIGACADTAPLAICLASLKAVRKNKP